MTNGRFFNIILAVMDEKQTQKSSTWFALGLVWQLGYTIAIPLVVFGLIGRFLDNKFGTSPWLLLAGILLSLIVSSIGVYRKTMKIMEL